LCFTKGKEFLDHISKYWHLKDNSAARFEVVTAVLLRIQAFWDVTLSLYSSFRYFQRL